MISLHNYLSFFLLSRTMKKSCLSHVVAMHFVFGRDLTEEWQTAARYKKFLINIRFEKINFSSVPNTQFLLLYSLSEMLCHTHTFIHFRYTPIRRGLNFLCVVSRRLSPHIISGIFSFSHPPLMPLHSITLILFENDT